MNPYVDILKSQLNYVAGIFDKRKDVSDDLMFNERDFQYNSPMDVISHAINSLNYYSNVKFDLSSDIEYEDLFEDHKMPIYSLILKNYEIAINSFKKMLDDPSLDKKFYNDKIPYLVMHTIQHIGQGLRLHSMNIKEKRLQRCANNKNTNN